MRAHNHTLSVDKDERHSPFLPASGSGSCRDGSTKSFPGERIGVSASGVSKLYSESELPKRREESELTTLEHTNVHRGFASTPESCRRARISHKNQLPVSGQMVHLVICSIPNYHKPNEESNRYQIICSQQQRYTACVQGGSIML